MAGYNFQSADGDLVTIGTKTDAAATTTDTTSFSLIALLKGLLNSHGFPSDTAATAGGTGSMLSQLRRLTGQLASLPASIGSKTAANSLGVAIATDDPLNTVLGTTADAISSTTGSISSKLRFITSILPSSIGSKTAAASIPVAIATDDAIRTQLASVVANGYTSAPTITRPANITTYGQNDVVGGAITFTNIGPSTTQQMMILSAALTYNVSVLPNGLGNMVLHLYSVTPPSAYADNAVWDLPSGDRASYLGFINLGLLVDYGSTCYVQNDNVNRPVKPASTSLFGYLVTLNGFTPGANSETLVCSLTTAGM